MTIEDLTARQLVAGLMRGNAATLQRGYSAESATLVAVERHMLDEQQYRELLAYAQGFADGFVEDGLKGNPAERMSDANFPADTLK